MVEPYVLDDFKKVDWVGIHYKTTSDGLPKYDFCASITDISNRNPNPEDDYVEVSMLRPGHSETESEIAGIKIPRVRLKRTEITNIVHAHGTCSLDGH